MSIDDRLYFERRAEDALRRAEEATDPGAVKAHYELLGLYLNRLYPADDRVPPPIEHRNGAATVATTRPIRRWQAKGA